MWSVCNRVLECIQHTSNRALRGGSGSGDLPKGQNRTPQEWPFLCVCVCVLNSLRNNAYVAYIHIYAQPQPSYMVYVSVSYM